MSDLSGGYVERPVITCGSLSDGRLYEVSVHVTDRDVLRARFATDRDALTWALRKARIHRGLVYEVRVVGADD